MLEMRNYELYNKKLQNRADKIICFIITQLFNRLSWYREN